MIKQALITKDESLQKPTKNPQNIGPKMSKTLKNREEFRNFVRLVLFVSKKHTIWTQEPLDFIKNWMSYGL